MPAAEARRIAVGDVAPDFTLRDPAGLAYHLGALRGKEAVVLVFFRGVW